MSDYEDDRPLMTGLQTHQASYMASSSYADVSPAEHTEQSFTLTMSAGRGVMFCLVGISASFLLALAWVMATDAAHVTRTHCRVANWLPSFSAVIGHSYITVRYCTVIRRLHFVACPPIMDS